MQIRFASILLLAVGATAAHANLIQNGSFEDPNLNGGWSTFSTIPGWYAASGVIEIGGAGVYGVTGQAGTNVLELDSTGNSTIAQDLTLSGQAYSLSFDFARRDGTTAETNKFDVLWNGNVIASITPDSTHFSSASYTVSGLSGVNTLAFRGTGTSDSYGGMIDKVNVQAVPEPTSMAALGAGVLGLLRRRRKA
jgi:hypothetical protein